MNSRELLKGTLSAIILKLLSEQEKMYGYEMSLKVKELSGGKILLKDCCRLRKRMLAAGFGNIII
jgi:DNA-binding PadR family transcriptional regulator